MQELVAKELVLDAMDLDCSVAPEQVLVTDAKVPAMGEKELVLVTDAKVPEMGEKVDCNLVHSDAKVKVQKDVKVQEQSRLDCRRHFLEDYSVGHEFVLLLADPSSSWTSK